MKTAMNQYNNTPDRYPALAGADQREKYCCQIAVSEEFIYFCRHPHVLRYEHAGVYGVSVCVGVYTQWVNEKPISNKRHRSPIAL